MPDTEMPASWLADLRQVPLAEMPGLPGAADAVSRVVSAQPGQVPVAAFNSSL